MCRPKWFRFQAFLVWNRPINFVILVWDKVWFLPKFVAADSSWQNPGGKRFKRKKKGQNRSNISGDNEQQTEQHGISMFIVSRHWITCERRSKIGYTFWSQVWNRILKIVHCLKINRVRVFRTGRHTPTQTYTEYPPPPLPPGKIHYRNRSDCD